MAEMKNIVSISITDTFEKEKKKEAIEYPVRSVIRRPWTIPVGISGVEEPFPLIFLRLPLGSKVGLATKPDDVFRVISRKCRKRRGTRLCHEARKHGIRIAWPKTLTVAHSSDFVLENQLRNKTKKKKRKKERKKKKRQLLKNYFEFYFFLLEIKEKFLKWIFFLYI